MYSVKEIFYTIQGEGIHTGRSAVFCRFAGCNLWTGRLKDRASAVCTFCDTDFVGTDGISGGKYSREALVSKIEATWMPLAYDTERFIVFTGGEPLLQVDAALIEAIKARGFYISVETNGTQVCPPGMDWICVSPKTEPGMLKITQGDELKFVYPQKELVPDMFVHLDFKHFTLQPMDSPLLRDNMQKAFIYCQKDPRWRLGLQIHKIIGCP